MKNFFLGAIAFLLFGIFIFLGLMFFMSDGTEPDLADVESAEEDTMVQADEAESAEENTTAQADEPESEDDTTDSQTETAEEEQGSSSAEEGLSASSLENDLKAQPVTVESESYIVQDTRHKALYPDMLSAIVKNNTGDDIKNVEYGFVAWDRNGLPVRIKGNIDFSDGHYFYGGHGESVNIAPGETHGRDYGLDIDAEAADIHSFKAVVISYEGFNSEKWENPHLEDFRNIYEGKRLTDIEDHEDTIHFRHGNTTPSNNNTAENESGNSELRAEAEQFIINYLSDLEAAYAAGNFYYIEDYLEQSNASYNELRNNVNNNSFPNLTIFSVDITEYSEDGDNIYIEVTSDRTNDNLDDIFTYVTGYNLEYDADSDTFTIKSYSDV